MMLVVFNRNRIKPGRESIELKCIRLFLIETSKLPKFDVFLVIRSSQFEMAFLQER